MDAVDSLLALALGAPGHESLQTVAVRMLLDPVLLPRLAASSEASRSCKHMRCSVIGIGQVSAGSSAFSCAEALPWYHQHVAMLLLILPGHSPC